MVFMTRKKTEEETEKDRVQQELEEIQKKKGKPLEEAPREEMVRISKKEYLILQLRDPAIATNEILAILENMNQSLNESLKEIGDKIEDLINIAKDNQ